MIDETIDLYQLITDIEGYQDEMVGKTSTLQTCAEQQYNHKDLCHTIFSPSAHDTLDR